MEKTKLKTLTTVAVLSALAYVSTVIIRIPLIPGMEFLKFDPKDMLIIIIGFLVGPLYSIISSLAVSFIEMITVSSTGIIGFIMNVLSTVAFILPATILYRKKALPEISDYRIGDRRFTHDRNNDTLELYIDSYLYGMAQG